LFTDGDTIPGLHQLREIDVHRMIWEASELRIIPAIIPACEDDSQDFGGFFGILTECLIKVANPEKQDRIGILRLDFIVLPHERRHLSSGSFSSFRLLAQVDTVFVVPDDKGMI
jgi:hypothetical protein